MIDRQRLKEIILKNKNGFTIDKNLNFVNKKNGYVVALTNNKEKDINVLINKAIKNYNSLKHLSRFKLYFGGWYDSKNKNFFLDISIIVNHKKENLAFNLAKIQNQQEIFNFKTFDCIKAK
jgi:hypothetical protein